MLLVGGVVVVALRLLLLLLRQSWFYCFRLSHVADHLDQRVLDVHVNVFQFDIEREHAVFDFSPNFEQAAFDLPEFVLGQQADALEHSGVGYRATNIDFVKPLVIADAFGEKFDAAVSALSEHAAPGFLGCFFL